MPAPARSRLVPGARFGRDRTVVLGGHAETETVASLARKRIDSVVLPIERASTTLSVGASIGIASFPDHADRVAGLKRLADEAMYRAKRSGRNHCCIAEATIVGVV